MKKMKNCLTVFAVSLISLSLTGCFDSDNDDEPMNVNSPPVAMSVNVTTQTDVAITDKLSATDADDDTLTFTVDQEPMLGTLSVDTSGNFTYQPFAEVTGSDSFTYIVSDGNGGEASATVGITIEALQVSFSEFSRQAFTANPTDEPLSINGREFIDDVVNQNDYQDLIDQP